MPSAYLSVSRYQSCKESSAQFKLLKLVVLVVYTPDMKGKEEVAKNGGASNIGWLYVT